MHVPCILGALYARRRKRPAKTEPPVFFQNADAEVGAVPHLIFFADSLDPSCPDDPAVNDGDDLNFVRTDCFFVQKLPFVFDVEAVFIGL